LLRTASANSLISSFPKLTYMSPLFLFMEVANIVKEFSTIEVGTKDLGFATVNVEWNYRKKEGKMLSKKR